MGKLAVIGDIGGHWEELVRALADLGVDLDKLQIPADVTICQVGDLIHRGPASEQVVDTVDQLLERNPGQWIQLAGNHEAQYLFPPKFRWNETIPPRTIETLRRWWQDGTMQIAANFYTTGTQVRQPGGTMKTVSEGELLVTHAGLTFGLWRLLGSPDTAAAAAEAINSSRYDQDSPVWNTGTMLDRAINHAAGVAWAEAGTELAQSWLAASRTGQQLAGFHQAHGHSSMFDWQRGKWRLPNIQGEFTGRPRVNREQKIVRTEIGNITTWGCDPNHGRQPAGTWSPLVLATAG